MMDGFKLPFIVLRSKQRCFLVKYLVVVYFMVCFSQAKAGENSILSGFKSPEINGFIELRSGVRTQDDPYEKDMSITEERGQIEIFTYDETFDIKYKGDIVANHVIKEIEYQTREASVFSRLGDYADIKIGRQILTWGTGDLVFLNDMFPKDWQSFFIGRDSEYLKAPSDAVKLGIFTDFINVDMVYTPKFDPDNFVTGEYLSHWDSSNNRIVGDNYDNDIDYPDKWFEDDEFAIRLYKNINNNEYALYAYNGFWKTPAGNNGNKKYFPKVRVIGFSARGQVVKGIANFEYAYYKSLEDKAGINPLIKNSLSKYLIGYSIDLWQDFNASLQYYVEQIDDYTNYKNTYTGNNLLEQRRDIITLQLTQLSMNQNLEILLPIYFSPTDKDSYLKPSINYKYSDNMVMEGGANIFSGENQSTFFAQFENNTNIYFAIHYSFL